jgi:glycosyltransferase involved in cell wall biosynthesis
VRVALIGPVPPQVGGWTPGGVATHQVHLATGLAKANIYAPLLATNTRVGAEAWQARDGEVAFPLFRMAGPSLGRRDYLAAVGLERAVRYALHLRSRSVDGSRREVLWNLLWYRRFLAEVRPDVIHVQHPLERCQYVRMLRPLEGWHTPLVVTAHSLFGEHSESTIQTLMGPNLRAADRVIAVSPHIAEQALSLGVDWSKMRVIRSGVDVDRFRPGDRGAARRTLGLDRHVPVVLFVGNLEPRKQVDILLRAVARVREQVPDVRLVVAGSGQSAGVDDQTARLVRLTRELDLSEIVQFVGHVEDRTLLDYYAAADVFALASSSEAQGIVALEAMACGLPVVATAVGGLLGTIEGGQTGVLVPAGQPELLAERLCELLRDASLRSQLGAAARRAVERDFSWSKAVAATLEVYREIVTRA